MNAAPDLYEDSAPREHMNHMNSETRMVHARLERWGKWARENLHGWPPATLLGRVIEQGLSGASQSGRPPISMPADIADTDAAVARLGAIDKGVIVEYYTRWAPPEMIWKRCRGIRSLSNFRAVLKRSRWRIGAFLEGLSHGREKSA